MWLSKMRKVWLRIKWFGNMTGKDNCAWYLFENRTTETKFYGRTNDS
jgi:hypothetical protein